MPIGGTITGCVFCAVRFCGGSELQDSFCYPPWPLAMTTTSLFGLGPRLPDLGRTFALTYTFAGIPSALAFAGFFQRAFRAGLDAERPTQFPDWWKRFWPQTLCVTVLGAFLVAVPMGGMPESTWHWVWVLPFGVVPGVVVASLLAFVLWRATQQ